MPEALLSQPPFATKLATSPEPSIANRTTANHQAHFFRRSRPIAAANVAAPSSSNRSPETLPQARKAAAPGLLISHKRSKSVPGNSNEPATTAAIAAAANRKAATMATVLGLCSIKPSLFAVYASSFRTILADRNCARQRAAVHAMAGRYGSRINGSHEATIAGGKQIRGSARELAVHDHHYFGRV